MFFVESGCKSMNNVNVLFENKRYNNISSLITATSVGALSGAILGRIKKVSLDSYIKTSISLSKNNLEKQKNILENAYEILKADMELPPTLCEKIADLNIQPSLNDIKRSIKISNKKLSYLNSKSNIKKIEWHLKYRYEKLASLPENVAVKTKVVLSQIRKISMLKLSIVGALVAGVAYKLYNKYLHY